MIVLNRNRPTSRSVNLEVRRQFRCFLLAPRDAFFPFSFPPHVVLSTTSDRTSLTPTKLSQKSNPFLMVEMGGGRHRVFRVDCLPARTPLVPQHRGFDGLI